MPGKITKSQVIGARYNPFVREIVIIDGNNLLHAVRLLGPTRVPGREKLLKEIERWASVHRHEVTLVFDGPIPHGPFARQMESQTIEVLFSGPRTADDCIVERIQHAAHPERVNIISDDKAILHEARHHRCRVTSNALFIASLYPPDAAAAPRSPKETPIDKPGAVSQSERDFWLESFDDGKSDDPFDGFDAMDH